MIPATPSWRAKIRLELLAPRLESKCRHDARQRPVSYLEGTIEDLRNEELGVEGYAKRLSHGEVGKGSERLRCDLQRAQVSAGFGENWISIEDGVEGMDQLARSAEFLRAKIAEYWG